MIHLMKQIDGTEQAGCETLEEPGRADRFGRTADMAMAEELELHMG